MKQKFNIEVTWRTVEVERQIIEVEAGTVEEALGMAQEHADELDWYGRAEIIEGEYLVEEV